jgi:exonuclease SbcC
VIPVKLELKNFLAFRDPTPLDLTGLHVACLAGANGAGKSALLDAITWALWGKARAQRDDELIHLGETEMHVILTFMLNDQLYRVIRQRSSKGRGSSALNVHIQDGDTWRLISDRAIRQTQQQIIDLLRLDYTTFINSAFLVQGHADEFTTRTPSERKEVLSNILGLEAWQRYEEHAKQRIREIDRRIGQTDAQITGIDEELARKSDYQDELIEAQRGLEIFAEQVHTAELRYRELESARQSRHDLHVRQTDLRRRIEQNRQELARIQSLYQRQGERLAGFQEVIDARAEIEAGYAMLQDARFQEQELGARLLEQHELSQRQNVLQRAIQAAESELLAQKQALLQRQDDLEKAMATSPEGDALREGQAKVAALEVRERQRGEWEDQLGAIREQLAELEGVNRGLKADMDTLAAQRDQISAMTEPLCPLCGQHLSDAHRADLLDRLEREGGEKAEIWRANRERMEAFKSSRAQLSREIADAAQELRNLPPLREHVALLAERLGRAADAQAEWEQTQASLTALEERLANRDYTAAEQAELGELMAQLAELGYDEAAHHAAREAVGAYQPFEVRQVELDRALDALPEVEAEVASLAEQAASWEQRLAEDEALYEELSVEAARLDDQLAELDRCEEELQHLREQEGQARYLVGAAQQRLTALDQQRARRAELVDRRQQLGQERGIYDELRAAFSKDGIPAMIIEAAIPEIEEEANQVLSRMTDGRMHLRFETQREKVTGGVKETLDIRIADELGTRDYGTFSGGEAFRVNFAIRLALSRLLARRAGAQLRTLFIDEGFGTQDSQGRERLIEAIHAIQDEFDLILVITHIEELKEAFPARIEVTKTGAGSQVELA